MNNVSVIFFILFISSVSNAQTSWQDKIKIASKLDTRIQQVEALTEIYNSVPKDSFQIIGDASYLLSFRYVSYFDMEKDSTLKYVQSGINAYQKISYKGYRLSRLLEYKGNLLFKLGKSREAFESFDAFDNLEMEDYRAVGSYLMAKVGQAQIFRAQGDNEAGIQLLEYAENQPFFHLARSIDRFPFYFEKSIGYGMEDSNEYNAQCDLALIQASDNITKPNQRLKLSQQIGRILISKKQFEEATVEFEKVFIGRLNQGTKADSVTAADVLINISLCQILSGNAQDAINKLNKSIPDLITAGISNNQHLMLYDNLLSAYMKMKQNGNIERTIDSVDLLISNNEANKSLSPKELTIYQFNKAEYYYNKYLNEQKPIFAQKALEVCWKMDNAAIQYENQILTKRAQYLAKKTIDTLYKLPIEISGKLKNQDAFFYFTERSKNNLLLQDLGNERYDLLPELDLLQAIRKSEDNNKELNEKLVNIRKEKLNYLFLENKRTHIETTDLSKFTEKLNGRFCLNYSFGSSNLYLQAIDTHGKSHIFNLGNLLAENAFESFYQKVSSKSGKDYKELADTFIEHLKSIHIDTSSILILPDDHLFLFPFDILSTDNGPLHTIDHSYELNASLFTNRKSEDNHPQIINSVVVNPSYKNEAKDSSLQNNNAVFYELPYSFTETEGITEYLGQNTHKNIKKDKLQSAYQAADLFHFSGHAILDSNELFSYLPLDANGTNLYAYEFNNWNANAQMVVLSACETGTGKIAAGEGVLSFSRSIIRSGAKSVVSTLWPVDDQSTAKIISNFYSYLSIGNSKSKALSKAKQDFLSTCDDYQKHPYYWAGIIITGDNSPVIFASYSKTAWLLGALLFLIITFFSILFFRKKKK